MSIGGVEEGKTNDARTSSSKWPDIMQAVHNEFPPVKIPAPSPLVASSSSPQFASNGGASSQTQITTPPPLSPSATTVPATPQPPTASEASTQPSSALDDPTAAASSPSVVPNSQPPGPDDASATATPIRPSAGTGAGAGATASVMSTPAGGAGSAEAPQPGTLPAPLAALYEQIQGALHGPFGTMPPHTLQRLSELILEPRRHYKTLPAYLRALDRVLSVSSTADVYPLKVDGVAGGSGGSGSALDSFMASSDDDGGMGGAGANDAFNGAELTPIPWLRHSRESSLEAAGGGDDGEVDAPGEMVDSSLATNRNSSSTVDEPARGHTGAYMDGQQTTLVNGMTRAVPADTAAAMQIESENADAAAAGVGAAALSPPPTTSPPPPPRAATAAAADVDDNGPGTVHARGPEEIGNEDIGPQRPDGGAMPGIVDLEAAVGRPGEGEVVPGSNVQVPDDRARAAAGSTGPTVAESQSMTKDDGAGSEDEKMSDDKPADTKEGDGSAGDGKD